MKTVVNIFIVAIMIVTLTSSSSIKKGLFIMGHYAIL